MMKKVLLFASVVSLFSGVIFAEQVKDITGNVLLDKLNSSNSADNNYALGYITAVFCVSRNIPIPDDLTMKKVVDIAKKYLEDNPKKMDRPAGKLLKKAFNNAFPKKKK